MPTVSALTNPQGPPLLCYVTNLGGSSAPGWRGSSEDPALPWAAARAALLAQIRAAAAAGLDWIHIREKQLSGKQSSDLVREALQGVARAGARVLVSDRLDVALAAGAGGVHLAENSVPPEEAQRLVALQGREKDFLVGVSCHSLASVKAAAEGGADYVFFGPVFATPAKAAYGAPQGLARLREVCHAVSLPVLAIGGITLDNASSCLRAGAAGVAAIRLFQEARDLPAVVQSLRKTRT